MDEKTWSNRITLILVIATNCFTFGAGYVTNTIQTEQNKKAIEKHSNEPEFHNNMVTKSDKKYVRKSDLIQIIELLKVTMTADIDKKVQTLHHKLDLTIQAIELSNPKIFPSSKNSRKGK